MIEKPAIPEEDAWDLFPSLRTDLSIEESLPDNIRTYVVPFADVRQQNVITVTGVCLSMFAAALRGAYRIAPP